MRSDYERAIEAERARNAPRDPRSGTYGRTGHQLLRAIEREVRARPLPSVLLAKACGVALGLLLAGALAAGEHERRKRRWL
jgi:ElaB/YqjD/DUF883 family membrane-anchored ribosome-binding protein